jgi:hypothetical protein
MDLDYLGNIILHIGADMKFTILMLITCLVGITLWCILGYTLEKYGVSNMWFMVAGFWFYPVYDFIYKTIMWHT